MKKAKPNAKRPPGLEAWALSKAAQAIQDMIVLLRAFEGKGAWREAEKICAHRLVWRLRGVEKIIDRRRRPGKGAARSARSAKNGEIEARGSHPLSPSPSQTAADGGTGKSARSANRTTELTEGKSQ